MTRLDIEKEASWARIAPYLSFLAFLLMGASVLISPEAAQIVGLATAFLFWGFSFQICRRVQKLCAVILGEESLRAE